MYTNNQENKDISLKSTSHDLFLHRENSHKDKKANPPPTHKLGTRQLLNDIRKRWKSQTEVNPMFLSDTLPNNMSIQEFCLNYELVQCQKRVEMNNTNSGKKPKN